MLKNQLKQTTKYVQLNFRITEDERALIQELADKYAEGNVSKWLAFAGLNCVPKKTDIVESRSKNKKK